MKTNFPKEGENLEVKLENSDYPQFDFEFAKEVKEKSPITWNLAGRKKGNAAFDKWSKTREVKDRDEETENWIRERESYMKKNFAKDDLNKTIAMMKWGGISEKGMVYMKELITAEVKRQEKSMKKIKTLSRVDLIEKSIREAKEKGSEMPIIHKLFEVNFDNESKRFIATKEIRDSDDEIVSIDGIDFERYSKNPVWIWNHRMMNGNIEDVIGKTENWRVDIGTDGTTKTLSYQPVYAEHASAQTLKKMHEMGIATATSIGFRVKEYDFDTRTITESELYEVSNVIVPANPDAVEVAMQKGLASSDEKKLAINEKVAPVNKKKLANYRDLFLGKELLDLIGYTVEGKEMKDVKSVYNLIFEKLKTASEVKNSPKEEPTKQPNEAKKVTVGDALEIFNKRMSAFGGSK